MPRHFSVIGCFLWLAFNKKIFEEFLLELCSFVNKFGSEGGGNIEEKAFGSNN